MMLFSGTSHPELSEEIAGHLGVPLSECEVRRFASSEVYVRADNSVRGADLVVVAPDTGRVKVAERLAGHLKADLAIIHKMRSRHEAHKVEAREVVGEVEGRPCLVVDDMIDTGGTMVQGSQLLAEKGAGEIYIGATHGLFSGKAVQLIEEAPIKEVVVTNTVPIPEEKRIGKLTVLSIAPIIASAIRAVFEDTSVSEIFHGENQP